MDSESSGKLYYTIGEVAAILNVNTSLIRYWEKEFPIIKPSKNRKGDRRYIQKDIENLKKIYQLVKGQGHTLEGAKQALEDPEVIFEKENILKKLKSLRAELIKIKDTI